MAGYDPLLVPNNRVGVHISEPSEVNAAAKLVNSSGGDWGYVTIPIRSNDLIREKWQEFFLATRRLHLIPIVRLTTYPNGGTWVTPNAYDLVDFANFLTDMPWPTKNRYVVLFNEPNHGSEWGGQINPEEYATLLIEARNIFKSRSDDFFLLSAGLDMSAPNSASSLDALAYYRRMSQAQPDWYTAIDGLAVHAYPNPAFSSSPYSRTRYSIISYRFEQDALRGLGYRPKPVFITETGWPADTAFYTAAYKVWAADSVVAITPFLLFAGVGDFAKFSLLDITGSPKSTYREIFALGKTSGSPLLADLVIRSTLAAPGQPALQVAPNWLDRLKRFLNFAPQIKTARLGRQTLQIEVADSDYLRQKGLAGRGNLVPDAAMLFVFDQVARHRFWMKGMNFPLDFIWVREGRVVQIHRDIPPPGQTGGVSQIVIPDTEVDQVVEVPAGWANAKGIRLGDEFVVN